MNNQIEKLDIEKFNPTISEIKRIVGEAEKIIVKDFSDKKQIALVRDHRIQLKDIRVKITKQGKEFRQKAIDFQKQVIVKEREFVALIEPEEQRLSEIEEKANAFYEREKRVAVLPMRREHLATIRDNVEVSDDELLNMDTQMFESYCNKRIADKNEKDRLILEEKEQTIKKEELRLAREKEIKEAEERARKEERVHAEKAEADLKIQREQEAKDHKERLEREEREAKERAISIEREAKERLEREERERKEKQEAEIKAEAERKEKLAKDKKYQEFLSSHGWTEKKANDFYIETKGNTYILYKKIDEITL